MKAPGASADRRLSGARSGFEHVQSSRGQRGAAPLTSRRHPCCGAGPAASPSAACASEEFPDIEAVQKHTAALKELNWFRYCEIRPCWALRRNRNRQSAAATRLGLHRDSPRRAPNWRASDLICRAEVNCLQSNVSAHPTPGNIKFSAAWMAEHSGEPLYWYRERGFGQPDRYIKFPPPSEFSHKKR